jgi:hypothetical protein
MLGTARFARGIDGTRRRFHAAALGAGLVLAACSSGPTTAPQSAATSTVRPTLAALGDLKGLAPAQVTALIGDPDLRRVDPPAEIWQYRSADCVLDLYFYDSGATSRMVYAETRSRLPQRSPTAGAPCRQGLGPLVPPTRQTKL